MQNSFSFRQISNIPVVILLILPTLALGYGIYMITQGTVTTLDVVMMLVFGALTEYGVTMGYHRMVVHKAVEAHPALKAVILALGSMAWQGPVINWASVHTKHHAKSDQEGDPHSPTVSGFLYAHFEWLLAMSDKDVAQVRDEWGKRYYKDSMVVFFNNTFLFWSVFGLILPAIIGFIAGGWPAALTGFIWGGLIRLFLTSHVTWSVNSVCHYVGRRMFTTTDKSRNNFIVGILALGEGWHNNHHAFPASAFHGLKWWQVDITGISIRIFEKLGWVKKVVRVPKAYLDRRMEEAKGNIAVPLVVQTLSMTEEVPSEV